jgi:hypothetical protein
MFLCNFLNPLPGHHTKLNRPMSSFGLGKKWDTAIAFISGIRKSMGKNGRQNYNKRSPNSPRSLQAGQTQKRNTASRPRKKVHGKLYNYRSVICYLLILGLASVCLASSSRRLLRAHLFSATSGRSIRNQKPIPPRWVSGATRKRSSFRWKRRPGFFPTPKKCPEEIISWHTLLHFFLLDGW